MLAATSDLSYFMRCRKWRPFWKMRHPVCSVSVTPSKARLIDLCDKWRTPVRCRCENLQGSTSLHFVGSHNGNGFRETYHLDSWIAELRELSEECVWDDLLELILSLGVLVGKVLKTIGASWSNSFCTCKGTADGRNVKCRWRFRTEYFPAAFHNLCQIGYSVKSSVLTLALFPLVSAV